MKKKPVLLKLICIAVVFCLLIFALLPGCAPNPPAAPTEPAPTAPTAPAPTAPTAPAPTAPTEPAPTAPTEPAPAAPTEPAPTVPTAPAPTAPTAAPAPTAPTAPAPTVPTEPKYGGTLRISRTGDAIRIGNPANLDRHLCRLFARTAIENLVYINESGSPIPWLATGWQIDSAARTVTLTLRNGVKFHDGTSFNAAAVKWNIENYIAGTRPELASVESVDIVDNNTVRLNLRANDSLLIHNLSTSAGMMISPTAFKKNGRAWAEVNPVGTGPFKFVSWERDVKQVYERFNDYWQKGKPYLDRIEWIFISDPMAQVAAFHKGNIDVIVDITPREASVLEREGKSRMSKTSVATHLWGLQIDSANPDSPFSNLKVRQAVWHAIDTRAIAASLGHGYFVPINQKASPGSWANNPDVKSYPYDPAKAKQLLAEAGYPNGFRTTIIGLNLSPNPEVMTAVQGYLKKVGITVGLRVLEKGSFDTLMVGGAHWQNAMMLVSGSVVPNDFGLIHRLHGPRGVVTIRQDGRVLIPRDIQKVLERAAAAPDFASVKKLVHEYQKKATDEQAIQIWLFAVTGVSARRAGVHNDGLFETVFTHWTPHEAWIE